MDWITGLAGVAIGMTVGTPVLASRLRRSCFDWRKRAEAAEAREAILRTELEYRRGQLIERMHEWQLQGLRVPEQLTADLFRVRAALVWQPTQTRAANDRGRG